MKTTFGAIPAAKMRDTPGASYRRTPHNEKGVMRTTRFTSCMSFSPPLHDVYLPYRDYGIHDRQPNQLRAMRPRGTVLPGLSSLLRIPP